MNIGDKCKARYPNKIPVIIEYCEKKNISRINFLVEKSMTIQKLTIAIRKRMGIDYDKLLIMSINGSSIREDYSVDYFYKKHRNRNNGCLHINVSIKSIF